MSRFYDQEGFEGAKYVMSPPLRAKQDQKALWAGLQAGHIHTVATDHCPFNFNGQKDMGRNDFALIPNGAPGIEHRMEILFSEGVTKNRISMNRFVEVTASLPALIFGLESKGSIAIGKDADIVLLDPSQKHELSVATHHHRVDYNAYEGMELCGKVKTVIANGAVVVREG